MTSRRRSAGPDPPRRPRPTTGSGSGTARSSRRPALIAQCAGVADVISRFASSPEIRNSSSRCEAAPVPGLGVCDDGMVIDLWQMKGIRLDREAARGPIRGPAGRLGPRGAGVRTRRPGGNRDPHRARGADPRRGIGWLERKYGADDDQLSASTWLPRGRVRRSEEENADLFWGIRGGGGNFGIVTEFEFRLNPSARRCSPGRSCGRWRTLRRSFQLLPGVDQGGAGRADDDRRRIAVCRPSAMPEDLHGRHVVVVGTCYAGPVEEGRGS